MRKLIPHIEWVVFLGGLLLMATMDPATEGHSLCLFEALGFHFCPGEGLGHSIAYLFRGEFRMAIQANFMGPIAVVVLGARIISLWHLLFFNKNSINNEPYHV